VSASAVPDPDDHAAAATARDPMTAPLLEVRDLAAGYGASQVLFGVRFALRAGEVATLLGRNGMGKTTTLRAVLGLLPVRAGTVTFDGASLAGRATDAIARLGIALVPEGRQIFPNLTVRENLVAFADNRARHAEPWTLDRVFAFFPRLAERTHNMGHQLSGGEQQRVSIARAFVNRPLIMLADEPTGNLDPATSVGIMKLLDRINRTGTTVVMATHDRGIVDTMRRRVIELSHGDIVRDEHEGVYE